MEDMEKYLEAVKDLKMKIGEFLVRAQKEEPQISASNVMAVEKALRGFQIAYELCEEMEEASENYGENRGGNSSGNYGRQRRSRSTGRYMEGGYGWMPMPGPYYDGGNRYGLAENLERMAQTSGNDAERNAYRDAARYLRQG